MEVNYSLRQGKTDSKILDKLPIGGTICEAVTGVIQHFDTFLEGSWSGLSAQWSRFLINFFIGEIIGV